MPDTLPSRRPLSIPVKVVVEKHAPSAAPARTRPVAVQPRAASPATSAPAKPTPPAARNHLSSLPEQKRRRLMWGLVAGGMMLAVFGWAISLGTEFRQTGQASTVFSDILRLFKNSKTSEEAKSQKNQEVQRLEKQVFPQFQSR